MAKLSETSCVADRRRLLLTNAKFNKLAKSKTQANKKIKEKFDN